MLHQVVSKTWSQGVVAEHPIGKEADINKCYQNENIYI